MRDSPAGSRYAFANCASCLSSLASGHSPATGLHFHLHTVRQARAFPRDRHRVVEAGNVEQKIAADRFLRFRKWAVRDHAVFARYDFAFGLERVAGDGFAFDPSAA